MKKAVLSVSAVCLVFVLATVGILAHLRTSQACSGGSSYCCMFDLKVRDQDESWKDGVSTTWTAANMKPGDIYPFDAAFVQLKGCGLFQADHVEIAGEYSITRRQAGQDVSADAMAKQMIITKLEYSGSSWRIDLLSGSATGNPPRPAGYRAGDWAIKDTDGDGRKTFLDFKVSALDDLPPPQMWLGDCGMPRMAMSVKFYEGAGNEFMGACLDLTIRYTLNQCSGQ